MGGYVCRDALKDTDDRTIERLLDTIRNITGESELKIQNSCGLFPQLNGYVKINCAWITIRVGWKNVAEHV